ncbi:ABC transporter permease [Chitinispirillales bacterium ANBcel5]|uniref:ABC transporter permease n=1 Tax=Cellulosispirillum alkaliphilum TaxID=3039283 RepID=UPI002A577537|nr:ABC transporter permease [Chitinispirillales bacterium ANBcel5]
MKLLKNLLKTPAFSIGMGLFLTALFIALVVPFFYDINIATRVGPAYMPPNSQHWLGTNHMGYDMVSLLIDGLRSSMYVGLLAGLIATFTGTFLGIYGGYRGGWRDDSINLFTNLVLVIPQLVIVILISSMLTDGRSLTLIALIIGFTGWTWSARAVRAQAASIKSRDHIGLARVNGSGTVSIVFKQILPYLLSYVFMVFIMQTASGILTEASISMIGLGPFDTVSLGTILNDSMRNEALNDGAWWAFIPAVILVTLIAFALYVINTSMEGVFNPRLRK